MVVDGSVLALTRVPYLAAWLYLAALSSSSFRSLYCSVSGSDRNAMVGYIPCRERDGGSGGENVPISRKGSPRVSTVA